MTANDPHDASPKVRFEPGRGWICSCTGVYVEHVDFSLNCHHWPLCDHLVAAARKVEEDSRQLSPRS
jgi:hypothetical protein